MYALTTIIKKKQRKKTNLVLTTHIPDREVDVLVLHCKMLDTNSCCIVCKIREQKFKVRWGVSKLTLHTSFHVESDSGNCGNNFTKLELVQDSGLT